MERAVADIKEFGAIYTAREVADVIVRWAVPNNGTVLDPSCGDGVFAAATMDARCSARFVGVEINERQAAETRRALRDERVRIVASDFFDYYPDEKFGAIVGNPPFIRYQAFAQQARERALFRCRLAGVGLNRLASSWAHFVVVAAEMLEAGGRLGLVLPTELLHASYAKPVLTYLQRSFGSLTLVTFEERLFPDISQDTLILFASEKGSSCKSLLHIDAQSIRQLSLLENMGDLATAVDHNAYLNGQARFKENYIDAGVAGEINNLINEGRAFRLGDRMSVDIGYVSGANDFFHLSRERSRQLRIPQRLLKPAAYRGRSLRGLTFTVEDWLHGDACGEAGYLLHVPRDEKPGVYLQRYINSGVDAKHHLGFKCKSRAPWFSVPHVYRPSAFLTSMSGERPFVVVNDANVVASNSLHILRERDPDVYPRSIAFSWLSSISALSIELEGHALGGGMLKLEPREAENVVVVDVGLVSKRDFNRLDRLVRCGQYDESVDFVDAYLRERCGVDERLIVAARTATRELRRRRVKKKA